MLSRRTFVTLTASLPLLGSKLWAAVSSNSNPSRSPLVIAPETGLLERTAGCEVARQMDYASCLGFRGFSVCNLFEVSESERESWLTAADQHQLRLAPPRIAISAVSDPVGKTWDQSFERQLVQVANWGLQGLRLELSAAFHARFSTDSRFRSAWLSRFQRAADVAAERRVSLIVESWDHPSRFAACQLAWLDRLHTAANPAWKLSVDTYRWGLAGLDLEILSGKQAAVVGHVELADFPGGGAPGTGQLPLGQLLTSLSQHGYAGVLALRHGSGWSDVTSDQRVVRACESLLSEVVALTGSNGFPRTA